MLTGRFVSKRKKRPTGKFIPAQNQFNVYAPEESIVHVETPNGIVNIYCGLRDRFDRAVDAVSIREDDFAGELPVRVSGNRLIRLKHKRRRKAACSSKSARKNSRNTEGSGTS